MLSSVMDMFRRCFSFVYTTLVNIKLSENISAWNYILVIFIGFSIISIVFRALGGGSIMRATGSTTSAIENRKKQTRGE